ncbi:MAG: hypothetical protein WC875_03380 [Candidatus Absconditabacterales bacterium]|jgi:hypothetical protein
MNSINDNNLPEDDSQNRENEKSNEIFSKTQKELAKNATAPFQEDRKDLFPIFKEPKNNVKEDADENTDIEALMYESIEAYDNFTDTKDILDQMKALQLSTALFTYGKEKLQQELKPIYFYEILIQRIDLLIGTANYNIVADLIETAMTHENDIENTNDKLFSLWVVCKAKFYLHQKNYQAVINSVDMFIQSKHEPIVQETYESCMLEKIKALCGLEKYEDALDLIEQTFPDALQTKDKDPLIWMCEALFGLKDYEGLEIGLRILEITYPDESMVKKIRFRFNGLN